MPVSEEERASPDKQQLLSAIDHVLQAAGSTNAHARAHAHRRSLSRRNVRVEPVAPEEMDEPEQGGMGGIGSHPLTEEVRQIADRLRKKMHGQEAGWEEAEP